MAETEFSTSEIKGLIRSYGGTCDFQDTWGDAHDTLSACQLLSSIYLIANDTDFGQEKFRCSRVCLTYDTSPIGATNTILTATLNLTTPNGGHAFSEADVGYADIHVVEGGHSVPIVVEDYGEQLLKITSGGSIAFDDLSHDGSTITLNSIALNWINKTGNTKLGLRFAGEKADVAPTGNNYVFVGAVTLTITYTITPPILYPYSQGQIIG